MEKDKNKKKTLTISGGFTKRMPPEIGKKPEKKPFNIYKKKPQGSFFKKSSQNFIKQIDKPVRKNFSRKFAEQQATKDLFILKRKNLLNQELKLRIKAEIQIQKESLS